MKRDLNAAVVENLAIFREEPEYLALSTLYSVQVIDMTLSAYVLVVTSATDQPPLAWEDVDLLMAALAVQLPHDEHRNEVYMIISHYLQWLMPQSQALVQALKALAQDQQLRLPHLGMVIPQLKPMKLNAWHQARLKLSWDTFAKIRQPLNLPEVTPEFAKRADEALVYGMYLEARQFIFQWTPDVLQHVILGPVIKYEHFMPAEYPPLLDYLSHLLAALALPQSPQLQQVITKVRPYVLNAVADPQWFGDEKRDWLARMRRLLPPEHLISLRELAERRGITIDGPADDLQVHFASVEAYEHLDRDGSTLWYPNNAGRARKILLPIVQDWPKAELPGRLNQASALAGAALLGDLMYAKHLQSLRYWQAPALDDVLVSIVRFLRPTTSVSYYRFVGLLLAKLASNWTDDQYLALQAVIDKALSA